MEEEMRERKGEGMCKNGRRGEGRGERERDKNGEKVVGKVEGRRGKNGRRGEGKRKGGIQ